MTSGGFIQGYIGSSELRSFFSYYAIPAMLLFLLLCHCNVSIMHMLKVMIETTTDTGHWKTIYHIY